MSKRKAKYKSKAERVTEPAVPEEILAEGSGGTAVHVQADEAGDEVRVEAEVDAGHADLPSAEALADAGEEVVVEAATKKGKRRKKADEAEAPAESEDTDADVVLEAADDTVELPKKGKRGKKSVDEIEAAAEPAPVKKGKRGKKAHADDASNEELAELVSEAAAEVEATDAGAGEGEVVFDATAEAAATEREPALTDDGAAIEASAEDGDVEAEAEAEVELEGVMPTSAASLDEKQLRSLVEALVFAADKPITVQRLRQLTRVADVRRLETALAELQVEYAERGVVLQQVSGGYQFRTQTRFSTWVQQLIQGRPVRLSRAQLETLAIVAYRQPITRPEIDDIRGVDSSATLKLLMDRTLIRVLGKREEVGRPTLFGTTKEFLDFFSLGDLRELPTLREYSELTDESRKVMKDRLGIDPGGGGGGEGGGNDSGGDPGSAPPSDDGGGAPPSDSSPSDASASASASASGAEAEAEAAAEAVAEAAPEAAAAPAAAPAAAAAAVADADAVAAADADAETVSAHAASDATVEHVSESDSVFARYAHAPAVEGDVAPDLIGEAYVEDGSAHIGSAHAPISVADESASMVDEGARVEADAHWPQGSMPILQADYGLQPSPEADAVEHDAAEPDAVVPTDDAVDDAGDHESTGE